MQCKQSALASAVDRTCRYFTFFLGRLSGCSPFLGDDKQETFVNVSAVDYAYVLSGSVCACVCVCVCVCVRRRFQDEFNVGGRVAKDIASQQVQFGSRKTLCDLRWNANDCHSPVILVSHRHFGRSLVVLCWIKVAGTQQQHDNLPGYICGVHSGRRVCCRFDEQYFSGTSELAKDFIKKLLLREPP